LRSSAFLIGDASDLQVGVTIFLRLVMDRKFVVLVAFLVQAQPPALASLLAKHCEFMRRLVVRLR
jgi:hypothetical protein